MRPWLLAESNWKQIKEARIDLAILPWGATEAHNYHLPYSTDTLLATHVAAESARLAWEKGARLTVLPTIPYGVNTGQFDIQLDINLNPSTQFLILQDIVENLNRHNIHKLLILNSHGGNDFKQMIRELGLKYPNMFISSTNYYQAIVELDYFEKAGEHAGEMETSLMMHLEPQLIKPLSEAGNGKDKKFNISAFNEKWAWAERKWSQVTADTGIGDPSLSSAPKGETAFKAIVSKMSNFLLELCTADLNNLYE